MTRYAEAAATASTETFTTRLSQPPSRLWPLLADTARLNEALEQPRYRLDPVVEGESRGWIARGVAAGRGIEWREGPFEWVSGQWWRSDRRYLSGPLKRLATTVSLTKSDGGGTSLEIALTAEPNGLVGRTLLTSGYLRRHGTALLGLATDADAFLAGRRPAPFDAPKFSADAAGRLEIDARAERMARSPHENATAGPLAALLSEGLESEVEEIRARRLARAFDISDRAAAEACLAAVDARLLELRFLVLCPRCRRPAETAAALAELPAESRCSVDCAGDGRTFPVDLAVNVEAVFDRAADLGSRADGVFCAFGPMTAPHSLLRQQLAPGERRAFAFPLAPGGYRARVEVPDGWSRGEAGSEGARLTVASIDHDGEAFPVVAAAAEGVALGGAAPAGALVFENHASQPRVISLERRAWRADALTGAELASLQAYRDHLGADAPSWPLRIGRIAVAAIRWPGDDALFTRFGDEVAAARRIESLDLAKRLARARNGGVVSASGPVWLAAFLDATDASMFAIELDAAAPATLEEGLSAAAALTASTPAEIATTEIAPAEAEAAEIATADGPAGATRSPGGVGATGGAADAHDPMAATGGDKDAAAAQRRAAPGRPAIGLVVARALAVPSAAGLDLAGLGPAAAERMTRGLPAGTIAAAAEVVARPETAAVFERAGFRAEEDGLLLGPDELGRRERVSIWRLTR